MLRERVLSGPAAAAYVDIVSFKPFNDRYGFARGDRAIRMLAEALSDACAPAGFVGHIGGDDFVCVGEGERFGEAVTAAASRFAQSARELYDPPDLARGGIEALDRRGTFSFFPVMSATVVLLDGEGCATVEELATSAVRRKRGSRGEVTPALRVSDVLAPDGGAPGLRELLEWERSRDAGVLETKALLEAAGVLDEAFMSRCLAEALEGHPDRYVRKSAARALGHLGDPDAEEALTRAATGADQHVATCAAGALPRVAGPGAGRVLAGLLDSPRSGTWVRRAAARGLGESGWPGAARTLAGELARLRTRRGPRRDVAMETVAVLDGLAMTGAREAVLAAGEHLRHSDAGVREAAWRCLMATGGDAAAGFAVESLSGEPVMEALLALPLLDRHTVSRDSALRLDGAIVRALASSGPWRPHAMRLLGVLAVPGPRLPGAGDDGAVLLRSMIREPDESLIARLLEVLLQRGMVPGQQLVSRMAAALRGGGCTDRSVLVPFLRWAASGGCLVSRRFLEDMLRHDSLAVRTAAAAALLASLGRARVGGRVVPEEGVEPSRPGGCGF